MKNLFEEDGYAEIRRRLEALPASATRRWGTMDVSQMLCHLSDAFRMALGERPIRMQGGWQHRTLIKWVMLYLPTPKNVPTVSEFDAKRGGTRPAPDFETERRTLRDLTERFRAAAETLDVHPIFGKLKRWQWGRWAYTHMDHHFRQFGV